MEIGKTLKYLRNIKGITQEQLSIELSIPRSNLGRYETDYSQPDYDTLIKFAKFFDVTTDCLLGLEDEYGNKIQ